MNRRDKFSVFIVCLTIISSSKVNAQHWYELDSTAQLSAQAQGLTFNNSIENATLKWILGGNSIGQEEWEQQADNLLTSNKALSWLKNEVTFTQMADSNNARSYFISYQYQDISTAQFSRDLGGLIMLGNGPYEDYNISLDASSLNSQSFHKLHAGTIIGLSKGKLRLSGGLYFGNYLNTIDVNTGSIYTALEGEYLDVAYDYSRSSSTLGIGAGIDLQWHLPLENGFFQAEVNNLGLMFWGDETKTSVKDTSFTYNGLIITDPNALGFNEVSDEIDSLESSLLGTPSLGNSASLIPLHLSATYGMDINKDQGISVRVDALVNSSAFFHWETVNHHWKLSPNVILNTGIQVFDLNSINWNEGVRLQNHFGFIDVGLMGIETAFLDKDKGGFGAMLSAGVNL
jgi:hypothetical protein